MISRDTIRTWITNYRAGIDGAADHLNRLDAALGDGDFGASMQRGLAAAESDLAELETDAIGELLTAVGGSIVSAIGGTSGPLVGSLFLKTGTAIGNKATCTVADLAAGLRVGATAVSVLGGATVGDKTMLDALFPALDALDAALARGDEPQVALRLAARCASDAAQASASLVARRGRASYTGTGGKGHVDPGAEGMAIMFAALASAAGQSLPMSQQSTRKGASDG